MGPKKKLKSLDCSSASENSVKLENNVSEIEDALPKTSESFANLYFALLPNEVMLYIIKYLSPADMLSLEGLKDQRIMELTYTVTEANFSSCRTADIDISSFFTKSRANVIKKINFNYEIYAKPSVLVQCIGKCKHLTHLSIIGCRINKLHLYKILQKCTELRELAWSIDCNPSDRYEFLSPSGTIHPAFANSKVKVVYLFLHFKIKAYILKRWVTSRFPLASCIFVASSSELLPICDVQLMSPRVSVMDSPIVYNHFFSVSSDREYCHTLNRLLPCVEGGSLQDKIINIPPYLLFHSTASDIASLSSSPHCVFSSVIMVVTPEFREIDTESVARCMKEVAGDKLCHLSVYCNQYNLLAEEQEQMCKFLNQTLSSCRNITILNIADTHFSTESPFQAICQLQNLKTLSIPTCSFHIPITMSGFGSTSNYMDAGLMRVVSSCPLVNNFILTCCNKDKESVKEKDLFPMKFWKHLKHVTMYSLIFRSCRFLRDVARFCKQFMSLTLVGVMPQFSCLYISDIIYVLKIAKNLSLIRINESKFNPMYEGFWNAVGDAKNLEGICILTASETSICTNTVIGGIRKLKHLHLFHFGAPKACDSLYNRAKQSMQLNGISNAKIPPDGIWGANNPSINQSLQHQYHIKSSLCCPEFHLNDANIF